ncbi:ABC transporter ATP-binding protein [Williamsia sterculiae]|uniref:ABC-2 type transport system ATP-binding protein n=1 Tax=Williamsia sterculiae TaxID=1344003 RepID=A0A1N7HD48_9NOCA|nr:ABC transporter ATP-binding protein [Williamsia sterculiae]SIS22693.1 ABC-2 type transport system ATP-binding protein [Williamsia sterculiae]
MTSDTAEQAITVEHLQKSYHDRRVLSDVSFDVVEGEIFGLLGPNGAGKTTIVECIGGLRRRGGGSISVFGRDPADDDPELRDVLGIQLQESALPDKLTVGEALTLYASFYPDPQSPDVVMERLGLGPQRDTGFAKLSGGQKQRLSVALALIGRPRVAILDELTTGLDPQARREVWSMLEELRADGVTLLLVSHFMEEAQRLCDRVAIIDGGRVVALDSPGALAAGVDTLHRLSFRPTRPLDPAVLQQLPGVGDVYTSDDRITVTGPDAMFEEVFVSLRACGVGAQRVRVESADLEDAFVELINREEQP